MCFRWFLTCALLLAWTSAYAASAGEKEQARATAQQAELHSNLGEFKEALEAYKEAYRHTRAPSLLFNIGQCNWKLGDDHDALHSYRAYLRTMPNPPNRTMVEARIAELEAKLKAAEGAGPKPGIAAIPEKAAAAGPQSPTTTSLVPLTVVPPPVPEAPAAGLFTGSSPTETPAPAPPHFYTRWWFWTGVAVVAGGITASIFFLRPSAKDPSCPAGASCG